MTSQHTDAATGEGKIETPGEGFWWVQLSPDRASPEVVLVDSDGWTTVYFDDSGVPFDAFRKEWPHAQFLSRIPYPSEQAAKDAAMLKLLSAAKNCGGGDLYIQEYGRTCHCPFHTRKGGVTRDQMACRENHSTACNDMWNAIESALSLLGEPAKGSEA